MSSCCTSFIYPTRRCKILAVQPRRNQISTTRSTTTSNSSIGSSSHPSSTKHSYLQSLSNKQIDTAQTFSSHINQALINSVSKTISLSNNSNNNNNNDEEDTTIEQFISFTLKGPKAPRKTKSMNEAQILKVQEEKDKLRGRMRLVNGRIISLRDKKKSSSDDSSSLYLQLTVKFFGATDIIVNLSLNQHNIDYTNDLTQLILGEGDAFAISEWGKAPQTSGLLNFQSGELELSNGKWMLDMKRKAKCKFIGSKKRKNKNIDDTASEKKLIVSSHDKAKNFLLSPSAPFFQRLGITDANGKPKIAKSAKLRQCQKFVEIVSNLVNDSIQTFDKDSSSSSSQSIITHDMGCGRGYLTFALHSHLYDRFEGQYDIQSRGVDVRPKLVKEINSIANELGPEFSGLQFITGTIEDTTDLDDQIDILIALHACDTATDDSIWYGIQKKAKIIVTAPCCHKEVRRHLNAHVNSDKNGQHPYAEILRHNIYKERIAETLTDSIRALLLEIADYDVQVFEFIGGEHTSKNVMITAIKRIKSRSSSAKMQLRQRLRSLAELHGIRQQKLALMMKESLHEDVAVSTLDMKRMGMPPI